MAKNKENPAAETAAAAETETESGLPEGMPAEAPAGMRRLVNVSDAPWVANKKGNVCFGKLINRFEMAKQTPRRWYYQVELLAPCAVMTGKGDDREEKQAKKGDIVNLNENFKTAALRTEVVKVRSGGVVNVWVKFVDKIKIQGGKTMWDVDVQSSDVKGPTTTIIPLSADELGEVSADEDTPF